MLSTTQDTAPEQAHTEIANNTCYQLLYDKSKNRVYFTIHGFWKNKSAVPELLSDWGKAISHTSPGFTVLTDLHSMITHPQELNELHFKSQQLLDEAGVQKVAIVAPNDKIASLQLLEVLSKIAFQHRNFSTTSEAEDWLDYFAVN